MVNYECIPCDYKTSKKTDYTKHCKTKKHIQVSNSKILENDIHQNPPIILRKISENITVGHVCQYCNATYSRSDNLKRHEAKCTEKKIQEYENTIKNKDYENTIKNKDYENSIETFKVKLEHKDEKIKIYERELEYYKGIINTAGGLVQKSVSALTYIMTNYSDAPSIEPINFDDIRKLDDIKNLNDDKLVQEIFYKYRHSDLGNYIGGFIVKLYKKDNPHEQVIWNTDCSRLTYLIKSILYDNTSKWIVDKKGVKTVEYLINPVVNEIKSKAIKYHQNVCNNIDCEEVDTGKIMRNTETFSKLMIDIDNQKIHQEILRNISSHFYYRSRCDNENKKTKKHKV